MAEGEAEREGRCQGCEEEKPELVAAKGDARSYYKRIRLPAILAAAEFFMALAREETGFETVTLLRRLRWRG